MSELADITCEKLENDIMSILYANLDTTYNQFELFNKILEEKYDNKYNLTINQNLKGKFLLVLRSLMSKYDDIKILKQNNIYYLICSFNSNKNIIINNKEKDYNENHDNDILLSLTNYIIDKNLPDFNYIDSFDGNTIYHDLVLSGNIKKIRKLIDSNDFDFYVKNNNNKTPIELLQDNIICKILDKKLDNKILDNNILSNLLINGMVNKYTNINNKHKDEIENFMTQITNLKNNLQYYESNDYKKLIISNISINTHIIILISKITMLSINLILWGIIGIFLIKIYFKIVK